MISIPVYDTLSNLTIFRDDEDAARFYFLPSQPVIAKGPNGKPQFTFLLYQDPLDRPSSEGGPGGGYLVFTTHMQEEPQLLEQVRQTLQSRYRTEHPTEVPPRQVTLAPVDFTGGEVRLLTFQSGRFVKAINLGKPSLFASNTASVAVELDMDGATLFHEALTKGGSVAAIEYNLTFPVRLPSVTILGHVDAKEVKEAVMGFTSEKVSSEDTWGNEESHEVAHRTSISESMESIGLVKLEILKGDAQLSEDEMDSLRGYAFRMMDEFVQKHFLKGGSIATEADRNSQWMSFIGEDITAKFDLNLSYRDVITRQYNPSAQINPSFLGVPIKDLIIPIDLNNTFFKTLEVTVDTSLDFDKYKDIVHSVVGHLSYEERRPDGSTLSKRDSLSFTAADRTSKTFKTVLAEATKDSYQVELEVHYKSGPVLKSTLEKFSSTKRDLTLNVPNPGVVEINFSTAPNAFDDKLQSIEVEVEYGDAKRKVPVISETLILDKDNPGKDYRRVIYAPWTEPFRYRTTYVLKDDTGAAVRSTTDWVQGMGSDGQKTFVAIRTPFDEVFSLNLIPSADWSEVREIVVDLMYEDRLNDYRQATSKSFSEQAPSSQRWTFALRDPNVRSYRYSQKLLMVNGAVQEKTWEEKESDTQSLLVGNAPGGVVNLSVDPSDLDLGGTLKRVVVKLKYEDSPHNLLDTATLVFKSTEPQTWTIARADAKVDGYSYDVDFFMSDGSRKSLTGQQGRVGAVQDFLFLPEPPQA
jgi:hypothetical protein